MEHKEVADYIEQRGGSGKALFLMFDEKTEELAQELAKIDKALERIESGDYLDCVSCGEPIGEERLKALPTSIQCIECAKEAAETAARSGRVMSPENRIGPR